MRVVLSLTSPVSIYVVFFNSFTVACGVHRFTVPRSIDKKVPPFLRCGTPVTPMSMTSWEPEDRSSTVALMFSRCSISSNPSPRYQDKPECEGILETGTLSLRVQGINSV
ncbi:hypothetical protein GYMLUDRAFT_559426 [Collybiopsis luxurians FD-317 M1]|uniref:Uncharacterized protein n=1 Tax=Collybiopsis luxurians FD-317 M1 TaxID=944289 RepID=A0A0D0BDU6_9AGAR|nr:hypothetical protein GYMLUDRAFT_559426 [Collybiopsis luxurians FD-317 M1]